MKKVPQGLSQGPKAGIQNYYHTNNQKMLIKPK